MILQLLDSTKRETSNLEATGSTPVGRANNLPKNCEYSSHTPEPENSFRGTYGKLAAHYVTFTAQFTAQSPIQSLKGLRSQRNITVYSVSEAIQYRKNIAVLRDWVALTTAPTPRIQTGER